MKTGEMTAEDLGAALRGKIFDGAP